VVAMRKALEVVHTLCYQFFSLARCILIQISAKPSDMGDGLIPVSKHSN
jgi:hypothetical protein